MDKLNKINKYICYEADEITNPFQHLYGAVVE